MRERIKFDFINDQMVPFDSRQTHVEIVEPTLRLLGGRSGWEEVEEAFQEALREISGGSPDDAITDAGRALEGALRLLGCDGNSLGRLVKDARKKGLLAGHDETLTDAIANVIHWVSADRSESGDAHGSVDAVTEDAWFVVHVVGALILRLPGPSRVS